MSKLVIPGVIAQSGNGGGGGDVPDNVYTQDNLVAGTNISITEVTRPVIDENTTGLYHFNDSYTDEIAGNDPARLDRFNISYITGKFGKAIKVNGKTNSAEYSTLGPGSYNQSSFSFTFDVWLKPETTSVGYFSFYMYSGGIHNIEINNSRQVLRLSEKVSGTGRVVEVPLPTLEWGPWFHFAYVNDVSTNKIYVFINGQKGYEATNTTSNSLQPCFASYSRGSCIYDELRISNVARWTSDFTPFSTPYSAATGETQYQINNTQPAPDLSGYLENTATGTNALTILGTSATGQSSINIGKSSNTLGGSFCIALGNTAMAGGSLSTAIGTNASATGYYSVAIGGQSVFANEQYAIAIGTGMGVDIVKASAMHAIQLGQGTNNTANSFQVFNYQMLDGTTGKIPMARLPIVQCTQAEYDALVAGGTVDANTIYCIIPA